eukprot:8479052-Pyramimonas_sp.AAC.1
MGQGGEEEETILVAQASRSEGTLWHTDAGPRTQSSLGRPQEIHQMATPMVAILSRAGPPRCLG